MRHVRVTILLVTGLLLYSLTGEVQARSKVQREFHKNFNDVTLRINYRTAYNRNEHTTSIDIDTMMLSQIWGGRKVNLTKVPQHGYMEYFLVDSKSGKVIYSNSVLSDETGYLLMPMPRKDAMLEIALCSTGGVALEKKSFEIKAAQLQQMQIRPMRTEGVTLLKKAATDGAVNLAIMSEGYTKDEMPLFLEHASMFLDTLFAQQAFSQRESCFNVYAIEVPSKESGITSPSAGISVNTAFESTFDSYGMERLLTVPDSRKIADELAGVGAYHVVIIANSPRYGGSGSTNSYCIGTSGHPESYRVLVHEFGHSFGLLADEYEANGFEGSYPPDLEPDEPNLTTLVDFSSKWQNLVDEGTAGLIEGGGYQQTGIWRGCENCMMRELGYGIFCPVCTQAIGRLIDFYSRQEKTTLSKNK